MRFVPLERLKDKMVLSQDFYTTRDGLVAKENVGITVNVLSKMHRENIQGLYIQDGATADITVWPVISPRTRYQTMLALKNAEFDTIFLTADQIVNEISKQNGGTLDYLDPKAERDYPYAHNINMAIISCAIGVNLHLSRKQLHDLSLAAILCDIGTSRLDRDIINKDSRLTKEEYQEMKLHVNHSYRMVSMREDISEDTREAIKHHHENEDGSGYPDGLYGDNIPLYSRILHVADVYDAMISKRPFKKSYSTQEAIEYCMGGCGTLFYTPAVVALADSIPRYPKGTDVLLPDGRIATVARNRKEKDTPPVVKTEKGQLLDLRNVDFNWHTIRYRDHVDEETLYESEQSRSEMIKVEHRLKIMAVDDQATNLQVLREILEEKYDLVLLKSAEQALKYFEKNKAPDLILMDINMPGMNGIEATRNIHKITGGKVPVLFVSTNHDITTVLECRGVGCAGFVMRPYNEVYIITEIEKILSGEEI